jgi:hypothetical protein
VKKPLPIAAKPMLAVEAPIASGYVNLHETEAHQTLLSLEAMPEAVRVMYRYLTVYDGMMRREHDCDGDLACQLRLRLAAVAASTMKASLDLALAGYYSPAYALVRHLLETWQALAYLRINPSAARQWFSPDGTRRARPPSRRRIANRVSQPGSGFEEMQANAQTVKRMIEKCHDGAHPSMLTMLQPEIGRDDYMQLGGNFQRRYLAEWMSHATAAFALVIHEVAHTIETDDQFAEDFGPIHAERSEWFAKEFPEP